VGDQDRGGGHRVAAPLANPSPHEAPHGALPEHTLLRQCHYVMPDVGSGIWPRHHSGQRPIERHAAAPGTSVRAMPGAHPGIRSRRPLRRPLSWLSTAPGTLCSATESLRARAPCGDATRTLRKMPQTFSVSCDRAACGDLPQKFGGGNRTYAESAITLRHAFCALSISSLDAVASM